MFSINFDIPRHHYLISFLSSINIGYLIKLGDVEDKKTKNKKRNAITYKEVRESFEELHKWKYRRKKKRYVGKVFVFLNWRSVVFNKGSSE